MSYLTSFYAIAREIGDRRGEGITLGKLGQIYGLMNEADRAIAYDEQCLTIAPEIGDRRGEARVSWHLGELLVAREELDRAVTLLETSVAFEREIGHPAAGQHAAAIAALLGHPESEATLLEIIKRPIRNSSVRSMKRVADKLLGTERIELEQTRVIDSPVATIIEPTFVLHLWYNNRLTHRNTPAPCQRFRNQNHLHPSSTRSGATGPGTLHDTREGCIMITMPGFVLTRMSWPKVRSAVETVCLAIIPTGSCEQHSPNMTLETDAATCYALAERLAQRLYPRALLASLLLWGVATQHSEYSWYDRSAPGDVRRRAVGCSREPEKPWAPPLLRLGVAMGNSERRSA